jgi:ADP-ribosylation factor-like protein 1
VTYGNLNFNVWVRCSPFTYHAGWLTI